MHPYNVSKPETKLEQAFNFTEQDLRQNRQGKLSPEQASRLRADSTRTLYLVLGALALIGVLALFSMRNSPGELFILLSCLTVPALITFALTLGVTQSAISPGVVSKRTGQIHLTQPPYGYMPPLKEEQLSKFPQQARFGGTGMYMMVIEDLQFRLTMEQHAALTPAVYTVYFVPTINKIVAVELVAISEGESLQAGVDARDIVTPVLPASIDDAPGEEVRA